MTSSDSLCVEGRYGLLHLPPEILLYITSYLPLSSHLILRTSVCHSLRLKGGLGPLRFHPPHRFVFSEWQQAAEDFQQLGFVRRDEEEDWLESTRDEASEGDMKRIGHAMDQAVGWNGAASLAAKADRLNAALGELLQSGPALEIRLFRRVLAYLGLIPADKAIPPRGTTRPGRKLPPKVPTVLESALQPWFRDLANPQGKHILRVMSLISWNGISGEGLLHFFRCQPAFAAVELIVKTDRFDADAWNYALTPDFHPGHRSSASACLQTNEREYSLVYVSESGEALSFVHEGETLRTMPRLPGSNEPELPDMEWQPPLRPKAYRETQVIINVGCQAPNSVPIKGRGLSAGYKAFCYSSDSSASATASAPQGRQLHVIFAGRSHVSAAMEQEQMLACSRLRCNLCKSELTF